MTRRRFLFWLAVLSMVNTAIWYVIVIALGDRDELPPENTALIVSFMLLVPWLAFFPGFRLCLRGRLVRRARPLLWAELPGLAVFSMVVLALISGFVLHEFGLRQHNAMMNAVGGRTFYIGVVFALFGLGVLTGLLLIAECLRPDREAQVATVFE